MLRALFALCALFLGFSQNLRDDHQPSNPEQVDVIVPRLDPFRSSRRPKSAPRRRVVRP